MKSMCEKYQEPIYALLRIVVGVLFVLHGASKFGWFGEVTISGFASAFGLPVWLAFLVALVEFVGGLALIFGLLTKVVAFGESVIMLVALFMVHLPKGINPLANRGELALVYLIIFLFFMTKGNGIWSLEKSLFGKELF